MATEAFIIAITTQGTREVQRDLQAIGTTGAAASKEVDKVKSAFTGLGTGLREATTAGRATQTQLNGVDQAIKSLSSSTTTGRAALEGFGTGFKTAAEFARVTQTQLLRVGGSMAEMANQTRLVSAETNQLLLQLAKSQTYWTGFGTGLKTVAEGARVSTIELNKFTAAVARMQEARFALGTSGGGVPNLAGLNTAKGFEQLERQQLALGTAGGGVPKFAGLNTAKGFEQFYASQLALGTAGGGVPNLGSMNTAKGFEQLSSAGAGGKPPAAVIEEAGSAASKATRNFDAMTSSLRLMRNALVAISFFRAFEGIVSGIADMQQMNNLLTTVTDNARDRAQAFDALGAAANKVRAPLEAFTQLFINLERSTAGYKLSTEDAVKTTQTFFATFAISGLDTKSIANVTRDMKEVFNLGTVQGRIFRSIVMQDQEEALVLSKHIVATGANAVAVNKRLDEMRAKGQQPDIYGGIVSGEFKGAFTGGDIQRANVAAFDDEMKKLDATTLTLDQGLSILHTSWLIFLNDINASSGIFGNMAKGLVYVGENFKGLLEILGLVAAIWISKILVIPVIGWLGSVAAGAAMATVQFTGMAISSTVAGAAMLGSFIASGLLAIPTLTLLGILAGIAALALSGLAATLIGFLAPLMQLGSFGSLISENLEGPFKDLKLTIADLPKVFEGVITTITSEWPLAMDTVKAVWQDMLNGLSNAWNSWWQSNRLFAYVLTGGAAGAMVGGVPGAIVGGIAGAGVSALAKGPAPAELPTNTAGAYLDRLKANMGLNIGEAITGKNTAMPNINGGAGAPSETDNSKAIAAYNRAKEAIDRLIASVDPAAAAQVKWNLALKDYRDAEKANFPVDAELAKFGLTRLDIMQRQERAAVGLGNATTDYSGRITELAVALHHGSISQDEFNKQALVAKETLLKDRVKNNVEGSGMDLALLQGSIENETEQGRIARITKQVTESRLDVTKATEDYATAQSVLNILVANGTKSQEEANRELISYHQTLLATKDTVESGVQAAIEKFNDRKGSNFSEGEKAAEQFLAQSDAARRYANDLQALNILYVQGKVSVEDYTRDTQDLEIELLRTKTDALSGFQLGMLETQKTMNDFAATAAGTVKTAFQDLQDTLVNFFDTGKLNAKKFVDDILANLTRLAVQETITGPLANALFSPNSSTGQSGGLFGSDGWLGTLFGGSGLAGAVGGGQLGSSSSHPMYVTMVGGGLGGGSSGGDLSNMFGGDSNSGGIFGGNNMFSSAANWLDLQAGGPGMGGGGAGLFADLFSGAGSMFSGAGDALGAAASGAGEWVGAAASGIGDWIMTMLPDLLAFADGGDMVVGGQGGTDSQIIPFRATPGEVVSVRRPGDTDDSYGGQRNTIIMHVHGATDPDSFKRSANQLATHMHGALRRVQARNG